MEKGLIYPCGTEIGLEIYKAIENSPDYELWGGSSSYDHGRFVYENHIDELPFITDHSNVSEIREFNDRIKAYDFDFIYPAMDGVVMIFSKYREELTPKLIAPEKETAEITRSKRKTYQLLNGSIPIPNIFDLFENIEDYPVFIKPDQGQGSVGAKKINSFDELKSIDPDRFVCMEYLPGEEYTIDCFTNAEGKLLFAKGRKRNRIRNGISVNAVFEENPIFIEYAERINERINQCGGWFFQVKEASDGTFKLLEVASRIAGTSAITRCLGINLPLLTVELFDGKQIEQIVPNCYDIELDRALSNSYKTDLDYDLVFIRYEDTVLLNGMVNPKLIQFIVQSINRNKKIILLTNKSDIEESLKKYRIKDLFDEIMNTGEIDKVKDLKSNPKAIYIDGSFIRRDKIKQTIDIPVFDVSMLECLL